MQQTNSELCSGGIHQHFFRCGLISFFSVSGVRSRRRSTPRAPRPPFDRPAGAGSSERNLQAEGYRPQPRDGLPIRHLAGGGKAAASPAETPPLPSHARRNASSPAPPSSG